MYYGDATELELLSWNCCVRQGREGPVDRDHLQRAGRYFGGRAPVPAAFPEPDILVRARGRVKEHELLQKVGVTQFSRETCSSALKLGSKTLVALGRHPHQAYRAQQHFRRLDMRMLWELMPLHQGEVAQISRVKEARRELEELFHREMQKESRQFGGWDEDE